ncbi:hypothetical protein LX32DRAFT_681124 [Colletotrichum zoysiae]|uniref:Uncharacterized protein n=1 Tax=Colletotrichum zoysiae TaxID=1216348 RepID=A0AAD9HM64_9PEZI|nr:hypothetical protein LX32DRAFT_681124 [Colletotrichum zoysiae]
MDSKRMTAIARSEDLGGRICISNPSQHLHHASYLHILGLPVRHSYLYIAAAVGPITPSPGLRTGRRRDKAGTVLFFHDIPGTDASPLSDRSTLDGKAPKLAVAPPRGRDNGRLRAAAAPRFHSSCTDHLPGLLEDLDRLYEAVRDVEVINGSGYDFKYIAREGSEWTALPNKGDFRPVLELPRDSRGSNITDKNKLGGPNVDVVLSGSVSGSERAKITVEFTGRNFGAYQAWERFQNKILSWLCEAVLPASLHVDDSRRCGGGGN